MACFVGSHKIPNSFEVDELGGGTSNISFDYRITAIGRKYETVRFADHTNDPDPRKMLERMREHRTKASSNPVMATPTPRLNHITSAPIVLPECSSQRRVLETLG